MSEPLQGGGGTGLEALGGGGAGRELPGGGGGNEMSVVLYANQQDSFLYDEVIALIQAEMTELHHQQCQQQAEMRAGEYARRAAEQQASLDGETAMIAENYFAAAAGEVWYTYQCKPIVVLAIPSDNCYSALPVRLTEKRCS